MKQAIGEMKFHKPYTTKDVANDEVIVKLHLPFEIKTELID